MDVDYARVFALTPAPFLMLTPELVVANVNAAYCAVWGRTAQELVGQNLFDVFGANPDDDSASAPPVLLRSVLQAFESGEREVIDRCRYDVRDPVSGRFVERYWSVVNVPLIGPDGQVTLVLHRPVEVTDFVLAEQDGSGGRVERAELYRWAQERNAARVAELAAVRRLEALSHVAVALTTAATLEELTAAVTEQGLTALGATGGAVAVLAVDGTLRSFISSRLGAQTQLDYATLPWDGPLPSSVAAAAGRPVALADHEASVRFTPEMAAVNEATGCVAWLSLPLLAGTQSIGALTVGWDRPHAVDPAEMAVLEALAVQCVHGLERVRRAEESRRASVQTYAMAAAFQRSLLSEPPTVDGLEIVVRYRPAAQEAQVGGDWHDVFRTVAGGTCLVIGDVAGHDQRAAAAMGQARNLLRGVAHTLDTTPAGILQALDSALADLDVNVLATAILAKLSCRPADPDGSCRLAWSNAGHPPPVLIDPEGATRLLTSEPDLMLGIASDTPRADHRVTLAPGETLLLFTDGLVERRGASIDDGINWLTSHLAQSHDLTLDALCDGLLDQLDDDTEDDVALLAVRIPEAGGPVTGEPAP